MKKEPDYYKILNVSQNATSDEIKKSYRKLSMIYHPDKNKTPDSTGKFQEISSAYEIIGDAQKRKIYDNKNNPFFSMMHSGTNDHELQHLFSQIFSNFSPSVLETSQKKPNQSFHIDPSSFFPNKEDVFSEFIQSNIMGKMMDPSPTSTQNSANVNYNERPSPLSHTLVVSFADMFTGALLPIEIERWIMEDEIKKYETEIIYVPVPKGVDNNEIIVVPNKGNMGYNCAGDIKIFIKLDNSLEFSEFKRHGLDLIIEKSITLKEALCSFSFIIKHLNGTNYTITNNRIIHPGFHKKIPNLGIQREEHTGFLIIMFNIKFPETLSAETIESLKLLDF